MLYITPPGLTYFITGSLCLLIQFSSVQFSCSVVSDSLRPHESQHARPPCPSPTPGVHSDSSPLSQWCHPAISSSVVPFSCHQSLPASESFPMSQIFAWCGQSTGVGWPSLKSSQITNVGEGVEKREPSYIVVGNVNWCSHWKNSRKIPQKGKVSPYDPAITLLGIHSDKTWI